MRSAIDPAVAATLAFERAIDNAARTAERAALRRLTTEQEAQRVLEANIRLAQQAYQAAGAPRSAGPDAGMLIGANTAPKSAQDSAAVFQELDRQAKAAESLRAKYVPLAQAQQIYIGQLREIRENRDAFRTQEEFDRALQRTKETFASQVRVMGDGSRATRLMSSEITNLSFQLNDVVTGLALGQSPFMILAQQGGQVYQILAGAQGGVGGAIREIGAGLARAGDFIPSRLRRWRRCNWHRRCGAGQLP